MVMADTPPARSCALREPPNSKCLESPFCLSHCATPNALSWAGSLFKSRSVSSSALSGLRLPVQQGTQNNALLCGTLSSTSALRRGPLRSGLGRSRTGCWLHQSRSLAGVPRLFYIWEFPRSVGNKGPSENASPTHLLRVSSESLNPGLFS